jgi:hypothetical protein
MLSAPKVVYYSVQSVVPETSTAESSNEATHCEVSVTLKAATFYDTLQTYRWVTYVFIQVFTASQKVLQASHCTVTNGEHEAADTVTTNSAQLATFYLPNLHILMSTIRL